MKNIFGVIILLLFAQDGVARRSCPGFTINIGSDGNIREVKQQGALNTIMTAQEIVDCEVINGSLNIKLVTGIGTTTLSNPSVAEILENIKEVTESIKIEHTGLQSIEMWFLNLDTIGLSLEIFNNPKLESMKGAFPKLTSIGSQLQISDNPELYSMNGSFNSLTSVQDKIVIKKNYLIMLYNCFNKVSSEQVTYQLKFSQWDDIVFEQVTTLDEVTRAKIELFLGEKWASKCFSNFKCLYYFIQRDPGHFLSFRKTETDRY